MKLKLAYYQTPAIIPCKWQFVLLLEVNGGCECDAEHFKFSGLCINSGKPSTKEKTVVHSKTTAFSL
jgi:hypothetical protein